MSTPLPLSERLRIAGEAAKLYPKNHGGDWGRDGKGRWVHGSDGFLEDPEIVASARRRGLKRALG